MKTQHFLLCCIAVLCSISTFAHDFEVGVIYYNILGGDSVAVTYRGDSYDDYDNEYRGSVTIPETISYNNTTYRITSIGDDAFYRCSDLTSITIPNSVTSIGESAFSGCSRLTSITIPESVTSIGSSAFFSCNNLKKINYMGDVATWCSIRFANRYSNPMSNENVSYHPRFYINDVEVTDLIIPDSVTSIGNFAFYGFTRLTSVTFGNGVTSIGKESFDGCSGLTDITIPNSVTSIGDGAFFNCSGLISITIPNNITSINKGTFHYCYNLTSIIIPNSVTHIGDYAFSGCRSLTSITIPNSVTYIGHDAFANCRSLNSIIIPDKVYSIESSTFEGCRSLTSVTIGHSVKSIESRAFADCNNLRSIVWNAKHCDDFTALDNPYYDSNSVDEFDLHSQITSFTLGEDVEYIPAYLLDGLVNLTEVTWSMKNCPNTSSSDSAIFIDSKLITSITFGDSVRHIPSFLCYKKDRLTHLTLGKNIESIGESAFFGCSGLSKFNYMGDISSWCAIDFYDAYSNPISCTHNLYINDIEVKNLIIPNTVTSIGNNAFHSCSSLIGELSIPNTVTEIGNNTFYNCNGLSSIIIPNGVTSIGSSAFYGCTGVTNELSIPNTLTEIKNNTFYNCSGLTSVIIPNGVTSIGSSAFYGCSGLTGKLSIPNTVMDIGNDAFRSCSGLSSVTIPNCITSIKEHTFEDCSNLISITIPNSVTSIGDYAFYNASKMRQVTIGNGIEEFGDYAFSGCTGLISLSVNATFPPLAEPNTFANVSTTALITVPCAATELYKAANYWNAFTNYQDGLLFAFSATSADKTQGKVTITQKPTCDNGAEAIFEAKPAQGYEFVEWNDGDTDNPRTVEVIEDVEYIATFAPINDAVEDITADNTSSVRKVFEDGTIYILKPNGDKYTIDGRKVN